MRIVVEIDRDIRIVGETEDALELLLGGALDGAVDLVLARGLSWRRNLKSITETFGVGTRIETPSSLPFSSGSTRPTALAAPVEVGIIDNAAARAR